MKQAKRKRSKGTHSKYKVQWLKDADRKV